ncbi:protein Wnt-1 isoform X1 [Anoplophora glabripennis]|uniref:protein Wnt-1 isoform X1 n=1 Tax=Anoplophora glabripennis TaxID=217634 RepID=UPI000874CA0F|nr:protein Wnt-1 isoform X1 [Anoplophora glabripennis]
MEVTVIFVMLLSVINASNIGDVTIRSKNRGKGSMWWGIAKAGEPNNLSPLSPGVLYMDASVHSTLRRKQRRLARENPGLLAAIAKGANSAIHECQYQFRNQRWNCSTRNFLRGKNLFGKIVDRGCRETAFIYAITSAAVTHAIARACSEGTIDTCNCETHYRERPQVFANGNNAAVANVRDFEWGGCSDNIGFGFDVSREFVDTGERGKSLREKMNLHNNEAGRWHVQSQMRQECKCHGMSGSCTVKTCWMRLPSFRVIGDLLKDRFDGASHVTASNTGHNRNANKAHSNRLPKNPKKQHKYGFQLKPINPDHKPPGTKDLVYYEMSPGFCEKNPKLGIQGTHGRQCNDTSMGVDGCDIMCCGRGYRTQEVVVVERCNCIFHWCCEVKCDLCRIKKTIHTCV